MLYTGQEKKESENTEKHEGDIKARPQLTPPSELPLPCWYT